jgi:hypothetical protein
MAAPLGPPPGCAISSFEPSAPMRVTAPLPISTTITLPSLIATGPSGNLSPVAISLSSAIAAATISEGEPVYPPATGSVSAMLVAFTRPATRCGAYTDVAGMICSS